MAIKNLAAMPYAQARVITDNEGNIYLQSYQTTVVDIENNILCIYGFYSITTRIHLSECADLHCFNIIKELATTSEGYDFINGNLVEVVF